MLPMLVKAFRHFVSSTFAVERELLQGNVFPALDAYCTAKAYQFHAIYLRWGVNEEAPRPAHGIMISCKPSAAIVAGVTHGN